MKGTPKSAPAQTQIHALSESFFRKLASSVPGILFTYQLSADRRHHAFPYISDRIRDVFGIEPARLHGDADPMFALFAPDDLDGIRESILLSANTMSPWCYRARVRGKDGEVQWYEATSMPEEQPDGSTIWYGQFINIEHYKALERSLRMSEEEASYQARFQKMIAALSAHFIHLGFGTIDECIDDLLKAICSGQVI